MSELGLVPALLGLASEPALSVTPWAVTQSVTGLVAALAVPALSGLGVEPASSVLASEPAWTEQV
jgi:hypothetical protein